MWRAVLRGVLVERISFFQSFPELVCSAVSGGNLGCEDVEHLENGKSLLQV